MTEPNESARENLDWALYGRAIRELAESIADDNYEPDVILAIARGGLFAAGSLGYALSVKNIYVMNVEFYTGVDERLDVPIMLPPYLDLVDMTDKRILIADDVADTGRHSNSCATSATARLPKPAARCSTRSRRRS